MLRFEWDKRKAQENRRKHGVSFQEAETVFYDDYALFADDPDHSSDEERFVIMGLSSSLRTLVVCHCYRSDDDVIRIITARRAGSEEQNDYQRRRVR